MSYDNPLEASLVELHIYNFGPIAEAKVNVAPFTILLGESNAGKSYAATLLYSLYNALREPSYFRAETFDIDRVHPDEQIVSVPIPKAARTELLKWFGENKDRSTFDLSDLPMPIQKFVVGAKQVYRSALLAYWQHEIERCFNCPLKDLRSYGSKGQTRLELRWGDFFQWRLYVNGRGELQERDCRSSWDDFSYNMREDLKAEHADCILPDVDPVVRLRWVEEFLLQLINTHITVPLAGAPWQSFFLPASRSGLVQNQAVFASSLVRRVSYRIGHARRGAPFTGIVADFMSDLYAPLMGDSRDAKRLARRIERRILGGSIEYRDRSETELAYKIGKKNIALERASSMVAELAPLVQLLKNGVDSDDCLFIEEPEAHLHPARQVDIATIIAALVNCGIRVVVTTHSDYFVKQISNLVRASGAKGGTSIAGIPAESVLIPEHVAAYWFRRSRRTNLSKTTSMRVDSESGLEHVEADRVAGRLYDVSAEIHNDRMEDE